MNWEYKTIKVGMTGILGRKLDERELEATMNQLGRQGWELVAPFDSTSGWGAIRDVVVIFKRPSA